MKGSPPAQHLAREVLDFYGPTLEYHEDPNLDSSHYRFNFDHDPPRLRSAVIQLQLGTDRTAEALAHELLHLHQPILGFPQYVAITVPDELDILRDRYQELVGSTLNIIDHETFVERFAELGFDRRKFLNERIQYKDYEVWVERARRDRPAEADDFPDWALEYFRHWVSQRHGVEADTMQEAEKALEWGSRLYPGLQGTAGEIRAWVERGAHKDPVTYPRAVNELLRIMRVAQIAGWYVLNGPDVPPQASWLEGPPAERPKRM